VPLIQQTLALILRAMKISSKFRARVDLPEPSGPKKLMIGIDLYTLLKTQYFASAGHLYTLLSSVKYELTEKTLHMFFADFRNYSHSGITFLF